jgi:serpin B
MNAKRRAASLLLAVILAGCGSTPASPSPGSPKPAPSAPGATATFAPPVASPSPPAPTPGPSPATPDPLLGTVVITVSDNLVMRSQPRVSSDSIMYRPWLPTGTELKVLSGPVIASGYVWYEVEPVSSVGLDGPGFGWVAMAGKDGEAWIAPAEPEIAGIELARSDVAREPADPAAAKTAATSINAFGLDLLHTMLADGTLKPGENAVFSPTSIALALGMARAGAKGQTASQMDTVLHTSGWDALGPGLNSLDQALASRDATWTEQEWAPSSSGDWQERPVSHTLALRIANAVFAQGAWSIVQSYLDRIAGAFGAGVRLVDYIANHETARQTINTWVSQQTEGRIPELLPKPLVTIDTRLVLVNAIYLKANWAKEFQAGSTKPAPFTRLDGSTVAVPTMSVDGDQQIPFAQGTGWQAVDLAYRSAPDRSPTPLAMTIILPKDLASFEQSLSTAQLGRITAALEAQDARLHEVTYKNNGEMDCGTYPYSVKVLMPRFGIDTHARLADVLKSLGMPLAFGGTADFTGIHVPTDEADRLFISEVIHQANIDVDEKGTTAAAATAVVMATGGCTGPDPAKVITFRVDRPFLFVLRDVGTGAVLFMGQVTDPSAGKGS